MDHHPEKGVELYHEDDAFVVLVDLEGVGRDEVDVRWHDRRLHVEAAHREPGQRTRVFHRSIGLPRPIREDDITATLTDGVLTVRLPIAEGERSGRTIEVT
ncbi:Hsp20/alpha crystallin family protein [Haloarcula marina]|uniref:Hsp20/alpha crystallin family protein n=1 Tax=Haloarcula marina TaxID=2961574 RepID=UPI0020B6E728|nr:Hsp20/alpha crystallin family protein [Halomicroarcula marina]